MQKRKYTFIISCSLLLLYLNSCSSIRKTYRETRTEVTFTDFSDGKLKSLKKILLRRFGQKPSNFSSSTRDNFTETFRYALINQGYKVEIAKDEVFIKPNSKPENNIFTPEASSEIPKETIREILQNSENDVLIDGYIYEKDLGNVIDPDYSVGIILKIYTPDGSLVGKGILSSFYSVSDFEVIQLYSNIMANKMSSTFVPSNKNWFRYFQK